jgi:hypothetical protein
VGDIVGVVDILDRVESAAVSSYSERGIESERSTPITVMPVQPGRESVDIFRDSFETVP